MRELKAWVLGLKVVNGNTDLMIAATQGDSKATRKALTAFPDLVNAKNRFGSTALLGASAGGHDSIVKMLLGSGADVNINSKSGSTALMFAAKNGKSIDSETSVEQGCGC